MELSLQNRGWESEPQINFPRSDIPEEDIPIGGGREQLVSTPVPAERCDWMDMSAAQSSNPTGHEVPYRDATVIAPYRQ